MSDESPLVPPAISRSELLVTGTREPMRISAEHPFELACGRKPAG